MRDQKYVVFSTLNEEVEFIVVFPNFINHDELAQGVRKAYYRSNRENRIIAPVGAGFINDNLGCYGESLTLGIKSRERDTEVALAQFK